MSHLPNEIATQILNKLLVFTIKVTQWSGRRRLTIEDIRGNPELPPSDLASLGSLKVANPEDLAPFDRLKKQALRLLQKNGIAFLGGYAVPEDKAEEIAEELNKIVAEFDKARLALKATFPTKMDAWIKAHPLWEREIRRTILDSDDAIDRFSMRWTPYKVEASKSDKLAGSMAAAATGLVGTLYDEIAEEAEKVIEKSILGRDKANGRILLPLKTMRTKLNGLAFLDPSVTPLIQTIDEVLATFPAGVPIEGSNLALLHGLMLILANPQAIKTHCAAVLDGQAIAPLVQKAAPGAFWDEPEAASIASVETQTVVVQTEESTQQGMLIPDSLPAPTKAPEVHAPVIQQQPITPQGMAGIAVF